MRARGPDQLGDALAHLGGGLVGERDGQDRARMRAAGGDQPGDAAGEHAGLARPGAGDDEQRPTGCPTAVGWASLSPSSRDSERGRRLSADLSGAAVGTGNGNVIVPPSLVAGADITAAGGARQASEKSGAGDGERRLAWHGRHGQHPDGGRGRLRCPDRPLGTLRPVEPRVHGRRGVRRAEAPHPRPAAAVDGRVGCRVGRRDARVRRRPRRARRAALHRPRGTGQGHRPSAARAARRW